MLQNLSDPSGTGRGMAVALLTIFYAVIASEIFFGFLYKAYSDGDKSDGSMLPLKNIALPVGAIAVIVIAFMTMLVSFSSLS